MFVILGMPKYSLESNGFKPCRIGNDIEKTTSKAAVPQLNSGRLRQDARAKNRNRIDLA